MVRVFETFANERQLRRKIGSFQVVSAREFVPKQDDIDYRKKDDSPWIKRFAETGGKVIISGDTRMRFVPHERLALIQHGMLVFFFDTKWNQWEFFRKCSLLIHHWPAIAKRIGVMVNDHVTASERCQLYAFDALLLGPTPWPNAGQELHARCFGQLSSPTKIV
jgi:hypothetical protein